MTQIYWGFWCEGFVIFSSYNLGLIIVDSFGGIIGLMKQRTWTEAAWLLSSEKLYNAYVFSSYSIFTPLTNKRDLE